MSGDQMLSLPGRKRREMLGVCPGEDIEASIWLVHKIPKNILVEIQRTTTAKFPIQITTDIEN